MTTQQPEALDLANWLDAVGNGGISSTAAAAELLRQHTRIAELEAQLEAIGAGGVSGPLMGQPQAPLGGRWYMVTHDGAATLCIDQEDAQAEAVKADRNWPHMGPHRAVQLVEVASIAASTGSEPVAHLWQHSETGRTRVVMPDAVVDASASWLLVGPLYLHPSPPEGMVGGWIASKDQMPPPGVRVFWGDVDSNRVGYDFWAGDDFYWTASHWMHIPEFPAPPTTPAGSGKGE